MNEDKEKIKREIKKLKKILKHLLILKKLNYNSSYVMCGDLISEVQQDLRFYGVKMEK